MTTGGLPLKANEIRRSRARSSSWRCPIRGRSRWRRSRSRCRWSTRTTTCSSSTRRRAWSSIPSAGHAGGTLVNALLARGHRVRRHRRRHAPGHRPPAGPRHERPADGGEERQGPGQPDGPAEGARHQEDVPGPGAGSGRGHDGPDRGADRTRSAPPDPDGGGPRTAARRSPAIASASASPAGRSWSWISITGRTHQIRVHLAAIGHPLAGDPVYGTGTSRRGPDGTRRGSSCTAGGSSCRPRTTATSSARKRRSRPSWRRCSKG